jgi:hypothetical protein
MSCKEVVTFQLDMGASISLLSRVVTRLRTRMVASGVKPGRGSCGRDSSTTALIPLGSRQQPSVTAAAAAFCDW